MIVSRVFDFSHSRQSFGLFGFITRGFAVQLGFVPFNSHLIDRFSLPHSIISSAMTSSQTQVWLFTESELYTMDWGWTVNTAKIYFCIFPSLIGITIFAL